MWITIGVSLLALWCLMSVPLGVVVGRAIRGVPAVQLAPNPSTCAGPLPAHGTADVA